MVMTFFLKLHSLYCRYDYYIKAYRISKAHTSEVHSTFSHVVVKDYFLCIGIGHYSSRSDPSYCRGYSFDSLQRSHSNQTDPKFKTNNGQRSAGLLTKGRVLSHRLAPWGLDALASRAEPLDRGPCQTMG